MKTERAIELLKRISDSQFDGPHGDERREALEMAIRALSGDGDTISRNMAIEAIEEMQMPIMRSKWESDQFKFSALAEVMEMISELPSAQPDTNEQEQLESAKEYCADCDHIEMCQWYPFEGCEFRSIPSAQPTQTNADSTHENTLDCVSRQAAIEVIDAVFPVDPMKSEYAQGIACGAALAKTYVEQLPSAQPQRILYANMSDAEFEKWLYEHGICNPNIHESIPCDAVPLLIDNAISELPSAQPHWIPCSERLPEKGEYVLAMLENKYTKHMEVMKRVNDYPKGEVWEDDFGYGVCDERVPAWMPLPEPYGGENE